MQHYWLTRRSGDPVDAAADVVGVLVGLLVASLLDRHGARAGHRARLGREGSGDCEMTQDLTPGSTPGSTPDSLTGGCSWRRPRWATRSFARTVVLVLDHDEAGALGVVVNRPSAVEVAGVLPPWQPFASRPPVLFQGGPVARNSAVGLCALTAPGGRCGRRERRRRRGAARLAPGGGPLGLVDLDAPPRGAGRRDRASCGSSPATPGGRPVSSRPRSPRTPGGSSRPRRPTRSPPSRRRCGGPSCGASPASSPSSRRSPTIRR